MIFSSYWFLIILTVVLILFHIFQSTSLKSAILAFFSFLFYWHFAGASGVIPILAIGSITYVLGLSKSSIMQFIGIWLCGLSLIFYKYTLFISDNLVLLFPDINEILVSSYSKTTAPLAISFFTFEFIHYLYDVQKGSAPIKNPLDFFHFAMFFPTLVAGPIKRFEDFIPSLHFAIAGQSTKVNDIQIGLMRLCIGFAKKLIADQLTLYIKASDSNFVDLPFEMRWIIFSAIAFRIYLDFSGYSDMAIGSAQMFGIRIPENFNWPYFSRNLTEFWRRWHISLSSWIRDYIYIPLGGKNKPLVNIAIVFFICGLWHGASWNFVGWGMFHGIGLIIQRISGTGLNYLRLDKVNFNSGIVQGGKFISQSLGWMLTTFFVWTGWLLFFYPAEKALSMFFALFRY